MDKHYNTYDMLLSSSELLLVTKELTRRYGNIELIAPKFEETKDTILKAKVLHKGMFLHIDIKFSFFISSDRKSLANNPFAKFKRVFDIIESELIFFDQFVADFNMNDEYFLPFIDYDFILSEILWNKDISKHNDCSKIEKDLEHYLNNLFNYRKFKNYKEMHFFAVKDFLNGSFLITKPLF